MECHFPFPSSPFSEQEIIEEKRNMNRHVCGLIFSDEKFTLIFNMTSLLSVEALNFMIYNIKCLLSAEKDATFSYKIIH